MAGSVWQPLSTLGTVSDRIVDQVERLITDESLRPGDRLPSEREMAALLQVSRPSLREAIRVLAARDRVVVRHGQGVFVRASRPERQLVDALRGSESTLTELFAMREVVEVPAARWAAGLVGPSQLEDLRTTLDEMSRVITTGTAIDFGYLAELDVRFHMGIASYAGNRFLRQTSSVLHQMLLVGMGTTVDVPGRATASQRDHEHIYAALAHGNPVAAGRAACGHIRAARGAALRRVTERGSHTGQP